ncbi:hypothetical protein DIPPA_25006 [Diplonema papillatum]|nr:hypothetical protein DIPPA_25006 [Diplonema papillatum]
MGPGAAVEICGLLVPEWQELNGARGTLLRPCENGRLLVDVPGAGRLPFREVNLRWLGRTGAWVEPVPPVAQRQRSGQLANGIPPFVAVPPRRLSAFDADMSQDCSFDHPIYSMSPPLSHGTPRASPKTRRTSMDHRRRSSSPPLQLPDLAASTRSNKTIVRPSGAGNAPPAAASAPQSTSDSTQTTHQCPCHHRRSLCAPPHCEHVYPHEPLSNVIPFEVFAAAVDLQEYDHPSPREESHRSRCARRPTASTCTREPLSNVIPFEVFAAAVDLQEYDSETGFSVTGSQNAVVFGANDLPSCWTPAKLNSLYKSVPSGVFFRICGLNPLSMRSVKNGSEWGSCKGSEGVALRRRSLRPSGQLRLTV